MSLSGWLGFANNDAYSNMNSCMLLYPNSIGNLAKGLELPSVSDTIFGDYTKWCYSLRYFPYNAIHDSVGNVYLKYGLTITDARCEPITFRNTNGYYLGQYYFKKFFNDFRDYEPYTSCQIYLPFYGYTTINIFDVIGKYIQFRLYVDYSTGQATYVIGVNNNSVNCQNPPYIDRSVDDSNTKILSKLTFNIGYEIPITSNGMADMVRNVSLAALQIGATVAAYSVGGTAGAITSKVVTRTPSSSSSVKKVRNKNTGRMVTASKGQQYSSGYTETTTSETDVSGSVKRSYYNELFNKSADLFNAIHTTPSTSISGNSSLELFGPRRIKIVISRVSSVERDEYFNHIYGKPYGEIVELSSCSGYSEFDITHIDNIDYNILEEEKELIQDYLTSGVYLQKQEQKYAILEFNNITVLEVGTINKNFIANMERYDGILFEEVDDGSGHKDIYFIKNNILTRVYNSDKGFYNGFGSGTILSFLGKLSQEEIFLVTQFCKRIS